MSDLEGMLALDSSPDARLALGLGCYLAGRFEEGEAHFRQASIGTQFTEAGRTRKAALAATHLGRLEHSGLGNAVVAAGWFTRARRPNPDVVDVLFLDVVPNVRVAQAVNFLSDHPAFAGTMNMTWELASDNDRTQVTIRAENVPPGISAEDHEVGLRTSLAQLATYLAQR